MQGSGFWLSVDILNLTTVGINERLDGPRLTKERRNEAHEFAKALLRVISVIINSFGNTK